MSEYAPLPEEALVICRSVHASPRLVAHLTLVHDVADKLINAIREAFPELEVDIDSILFGAATHDIGKSVHPQELSGPGSQHERAGFALLRSLGVTSERARFTYTHAAGANESGTKLEDLLVALADNCWKAKRVAPLEEEVVRMISENLHKESWEVFAALDGILQRLAGGC